MEMLAANSGIISFPVLGLSIFMAWVICADGVATDMGASAGSDALMRKRAMINSAVLPVVFYYSAIMLLG
jgi:phosphate/sulfate permease